MPSTSESIEVLLEPADNTRLARLAGPLEENLRQIESACDVAISRRGSRFSLSGDEHNTALAAAALRRFYTSAARDLTPEDIQLGLIELRYGAAGDTRNAAADPQTPAVIALPSLLTRRGDLHARTPRQSQYLQQILSHDITFGIGPAGTGKTYLATACAVDALERDAVKRIVLVRPAVEAGEKLGFLPGDMAQKVDPYLRPLYDALYDLMGFERVPTMFERGAIEIAPLAFMRGRTLNHSSRIR